MPVHDDLGTRMKTYYEQIPNIKLMRRTPVIIRLDGAHFHTFTRDFQKPFDEILIKTMQETTRYLCENIQGCVFGYTQSDEITLVLVDYQKLDSAAWFDYKVQKMCSTSAAMATMQFNKRFKENVYNMIDYDIATDIEIGNHISDSFCKLSDKYHKAIDIGATFDSRVFNIPKEEVTNCIYWRQLDSSRNSIQMLGQAHFSHKELQNKSCSDIQDMLMLQKGINWNDLETYKKRGTCVVRKKIYGTCYEHDFLLGYEWFIDKDIPIFKGKDREYIEQLI